MELLTRDRLSAPTVRVNLNDTLNVCEVCIQKTPLTRRESIS